MTPGSSTRQAKENLPGERIQALAWWSSAQLEPVASQLHTAWATWAQAWLPGSPAGGLAPECKMAHERADCAKAHWIPLGMRGPASAWIEVLGDTPIIALTEALFGRGQAGDRGSASKDSIAQSVAMRAWADLRRSLQAALNVDEEVGQAKPEHLSFRPWSGNVAIRLAANGMGCSLLLNAQCVEALPRAGPRPPATTANPKSPKARPSRVETALGPRKITLRVELTACELELGSLQDLRVGDIVPLQHSLETPLLVSLAGGVPLCAGFLGKQGVSKAVELVREPSNSQSATQSNYSQ